jgi:polyisoprenoid-binding protein YceI
MSSMSTAERPAGALPLTGGRWVLDQMHSGVTFSVRHLGLSKVRGRFDDVTATLDVGERAEDVVIEAAIDMASVDTNNADRDKHLRSTDFFDVDKNPAMTFRSTKVTGGGSDWILDGDLTINGVTRSVSWAVAYNGVNALGDTPHAGFEVEGHVKRSDFGIDFGLTGVENIVVADTVRFELDLQFVQAPTAEAEPQR